MQFEYSALVFMTFFFLLAWIPSSYGKFKSYGARWIGSNRSPVKDKELLPWAGRAERAYNNLKDFFPGFAIAIILLGLLGKFDQGTTLAAGLYVLARLGHFIVYMSGYVLARGLCWVFALIANVYLLIKVIA